MAFPVSPSDGQRYTTPSGSVYQYVAATDYWMKVTSEPGIFRASKNAIINGEFKVWQRNTSFVPWASGAFGPDRFQNSRIGAAVYSAIQSTDVPTNDFLYSMKLDVTTGNASPGAPDADFFLHKIEGYNFKRFVGQQATFSFWVKASRTGVMTIDFTSSNADRVYAAEVTINSAGVWEHKTVTLTFNYSGGTWLYTNGLGLTLYFWLLAGSNYRTATPNSWPNTGYATTNQANFIQTTGDYVYLTGMQLEEGTKATDYEHRLFDDELQSCQRYYEKSYNYGTVPGTAAGFINCSWIYLASTVNVGGGATSVPYKVRKRTGVTPVLYSPQTGTSGQAHDYTHASDVAGNVAGSGDTCLVWSASMTANAATMSIGASWVCDAEL
jgi:hypothetical protein